MSGSNEAVLAAIGNLGERIGTLDGNIGALGERIGTLDDGIGTLDGLIEALGERIGTLDEGIGALDKRIGTLDERIGALDKRIGTLDERVDTVTAEVARLRVDFMGRLDRQQDMLTSIRGDIGVNMAATDRVRDANGETRKDMLQLTEQVSLIHRRLIQLEERVDRRGSGA